MLVSETTVSADLLRLIVVDRSHHKVEQLFTQ